MSTSSEAVGNVARAMPMPAIKQGGKSQKEVKAEATGTVETKPVEAVANPTVENTGLSAEDNAKIAAGTHELHEDPETGDITARAIASAPVVNDNGSRTFAKTAIERLITGYYFEDAPAAKESSRKPTRPGEPTIFSLRVARVHWKVADTDYELMPSSISRQRRVWSHVEGEGDKARLVIDKQEQKIVISAPGVMVGDNTWIPALTRGNNKRQADPEFAAMRERVRLEWLKERRARVAAGEIVGGVAYTPDTAAMSDDELGALGLANLG